MEDQLASRIVKLSSNFQEAANTLARLPGHSVISDIDTIHPTDKAIKEALDDPTPDKLEKAQEQYGVFKAYFDAVRIGLTDTLTEIPNKLAFDRQLEIAVTKTGAIALEAPETAEKRTSSETPSIPRKEEGQYNHFALIRLDIDSFKGLNDTFGHDAGDVGLKEIARLLEETVREDNNLFFQNAGRVARIGGDEFTIILHAATNTEEEAAEQFEKALERIRKELAVRSFEYENKNFPLVTSSGMYILNKGDTPKIASEKADAAAYEHKSSKEERYKHSVTELKKQGIKNLHTYKDIRASEEEKKYNEALGKAVKEILKNPDNLLPDAIEVLKKAGVRSLTNDSGQEFDFG